MSPRSFPLKGPRLTLLGLEALLLSGCMNLSGLGGSSRYGCGAPDGVSCQSVSATYAQGPRGAKETPEAKPLEATEFKPSFRTLQRAPTTEATVPLRTPPRMLRLWFKPWQDGPDLVDQGYVYVLVDPGSWQLESWQRQVRKPYAAIKPTPRPPATALTPDAGASEPSSPPPAPAPIPIPVPVHLPTSEPLRP